MLRVPAFIRGVLTTIQFRLVSNFHSYLFKPWVFFGLFLFFLKHVSFQIFGNFPGTSKLMISNFHCGQSMFHVIWNLRSIESCFMASFTKTRSVFTWKNDILLMDVVFYKCQLGQVGRWYCTRFKYLYWFSAYLLGHGERDWTAVYSNGFFYFSLQDCQFLIHIFGSSVLDINI